MKILYPGNTKLGPGVYTTSLAPVTTCPGASSYCKSVCYAEKGNYNFPSVKKSLMDRSLHPVQDLPGWKQLPDDELRRLKVPSAIRIHAAGDFFSVPYIEAWREAAASYLEHSFYAYTRSWIVPRLVPALDRFSVVPNVKLWASWDESMPEPEVSWPIARLRAQPLATDVVCPEQTGKKDTCSDCGLCWNANVLSGFTLTFKEH